MSLWACDLLRLEALEPVGLRALKSSSLKTRGPTVLQVLEPVGPWACDPLRP